MLKRLRQRLRLALMISWRKFIGRCIICGEELPYLDITNDRCRICEKRLKFGVLYGMNPRKESEWIK